MEKKSQVSIEFILLIGAVLLFFTIFLLMIYKNISDKIKEKQNQEARAIAERVKTEIELASESTDGYTREFFIPSTINEEDYSITLTENKVYITGNKIGIALPIAKINGQIKKGDNIIKKQNGIIYLN